MNDSEKEKNVPLMTESERKLYKLIESLKVIKLNNIFVSVK